MFRIPIFRVKESKRFESDPGFIQAIYVRIYKIIAVLFFMITSLFNLETASTYQIITIYK